MKGPTLLLFQRTARIVTLLAMGVVVFYLAGQSRADVAVSYITSPSQGQCVEGSTVNVSYRTNIANSSYNHFHLQLDDGAVIYDTDFDGQYQFSSVPLGNHVLKGYYADANHVAVSPVHQVTFSTVMPGTACPTPTPKTTYTPDPSASQPPPPSVPCHNYTSTTSIPSGFGSPVDVVSGGENVIMQAKCSSSSATVTVGSQSQSQYVYHKGYVAPPGATSWQEVAYIGSGQKVSNAWYVGSTSLSIPIPNYGVNKHYYVLAYTCGPRRKPCNGCRSRPACSRAR